MHPEGELDEDASEEESPSGVFTQQRSPVTGKVEWVSRDANYDFYQEIARSDYGDMLHDVDRNKKYDAALLATITYLKRTQPDTVTRVLDIGTGTGLLSMMSARCLRKFDPNQSSSDSVVACEAFDPMAQLARKIVAANQLDSSIRIVSKRSTQLTVDDLFPDADEKPKANLCVAELFDTELIGEGALSSYLHAVENLLVPKPFMVPARAHVYVLPVRSSFLSHFGRFRDVNLCLPSASVTLAAPAGAEQCAGGTLLFDAQLSALEPYVHFEPLCDPLHVFSFDFGAAESLQYDEVTTRRFQIDAAPIRAAYLAQLNDTQRRRVAAYSTGSDMDYNGAVDCLLFWWTAQMVDDRVATSLQLDLNDHCISCAPAWVPLVFAHLPEHSSVPPSWRDHWLSAVYFPRPTATRVASLDLELVATHDECSLWFDVRAASVDTQQHTRIAVPRDVPARAAFEHSRPFCSCGAHNSFSKQRIAFLNNLDGWWTAMAELLTRHASTFSVPNATVVVLSDGSPLGVLVRRLFPHVRVLQLDRGLLTKRVATAYISSNAAKEGSDANATQDYCRLVNSVQEIQQLQRALSCNVCAVLAEPFYSFSVLPWHSLHFGFAVNEVATALSLALSTEQNATSTLVIPRSAKLCAALVQFDNLHLTRAAIGECERLDLNAFESVLQAAQERAREFGAAEAHALFEYPGRLLSSAVCVRQFNFANDTDWRETQNDLLFEHVRFDIATVAAEQCQLNGIAFWMEYEMDSQWSYSTGLLQQTAIDGSVQWYDMWNACCKQAVFLFRNAHVISLGQGSSAHCLCSFRLKLATGDLVCESTEIKHA